MLLTTSKPALRTVFRILVVASLLLPILGSVHEFAVTPQLSEDEQVILQWSGHGGILDGMFESEPDEPLSVGAVLALFGLVMVVLGLLAVQIGLFLFKRWARNWYAVATWVFLPASLLLGWNVTLPWPQFCYDLSMMMSGGILALCYASPLAEEFQPAPPSATTQALDGSH